MSELPEGWTRLPLESVVSEGPSNGYSPQSGGDANGTLTLKLSATTAGHLILNDATTKRIHEHVSPDSKLWLVPGDILIQRSNTLEYVGTTALYEGPPRRYIYPDLMMRVRAQRDVVEPEYLVRALNAPATRSALRKRATGTAGNMPKINGATVRGLLVDVPPLPEQRRIVAKLDVLQSRSRRAKDALDAIPALLERFRQSVLAAAFRGDLTADWRAKHPDVEPASELLKRIRFERRRHWEEAELAKMQAKGKAPRDERWKAKYEEPKPLDASELPELPESWCWTTAAEACLTVVDCHNKTAPYTGSGIPLVRTTNVRGGRVDLADTKFVSEATYSRWSKRCPPEPGDILFTREAPMGEAGMVPPDARLCMGQRIMLLRADGVRLRNVYLLLALQAPHVMTYADRLSVGTGVRHLRVGDVERLPIPLPPTCEQIAIAELSRGTEQI